MKLTSLHTSLMVATLASLVLVGCKKAAPDNDAQIRREIVSHYADLAHAVYQDSLTTAQQLFLSVEDLVNNPAESTFEKAKDDWLAARRVYGQSEAFRFGNPNVDAWEGRVNAWPLDEGLIDYVDTSRYDYVVGNPHGLENIIGSGVDINQTSIESYHEKAGAEANVASGYHAIEFLLWGQDLNEPFDSAGQRPWTDYAADEQCTHGNCDRRGRYLLEATRLLVKDLQVMAADWAPGSAHNYRADLLSKPPQEGLRRMVFSLGSLALGELAGERMKVALLARSQEDEHSCFSDNTHVDIMMNILGMANVWGGVYGRVDAQLLSGPSLKSYLETIDRELAASVETAFDQTIAAGNRLFQTAANGEPFDQQILQGNTTGNQNVRAVITALEDLTEELEKVPGALELPWR